MTNQKELVHKFDWDILVVIDACRYDYFKKYYREIFDNGKLQKVKSPAVWTFGWIVETFKGKVWHDIVLLKNWVSGYVLSKEEFDMESKDWIITDVIKHMKYQSYAKKKFFDTVIKMQPGKEYATLYPEDAYNKTLDAIKKYPDKKIVLFFRQVHEPYLYWLERNMVPDEEQDWRPGDSKIGQIKRLIYVNFIQKILTSEQMWKIVDTFGLQPNGPTGNIWLKYGWEGVIKGYTEDMKTVLRYAKKLADKYPDKKVVITSDHGELLGEHGRFGHTTNKRYKEVVEVPWFVIGGRDDKN